MLTTTIDSPLKQFVRDVVDSFPELTDQRVIAALEAIERKPFFPESHQLSAYTISHISLDGYSLSHPGLVGYMVQSLGIKETDKVLDVGAGSGYHAAVMSQLCRNVFGVEVLPYAVERARKALDTVGVKNVSLKLGDGWEGWEQHAPFDAINIACGIDRIPYSLIDQLKVGGKMILPLSPEGESPYKACQQLTLVEKMSEARVKDDGVRIYPLLKIVNLMPVRFMSMTTPHLGH